MSRRPYRQAKVPALPAAADGARKNLLAKIHIQQKELALSDESYRDVLQRVTGHRSAALCDDRQLYEVLKEFDRLGAGRKASARPIADSPMARRCRALWLNLFHLDEIEDGAETALAAFVRRQTGREDMRFCNAEQLSDVIEALKDWGKRCGLAGLSAGADPRAPRRALVRLQWQRLHDAGWANVAGDWGLMGYARARGVVPRDMPLDEMAPVDLDNLTMKLGAVVRQQRLGSRHVRHDDHAGDAG